MNISITKDLSLEELDSAIQGELHGKELWGDISISEAEYEYIRGRLSDALKSDLVSILSLCQNNPETFTTFLVFMVRYKYDANFWGLMRTELGLPASVKIPESDIGYVVRRTFDSYGFDYSDTRNERRVNMEPILYEAGLPPESSLNDLFYILNYDTYNIFDPQLIIDDLINMRSYQIRKPMFRFFNRFRGDRAIEFMLEVHDAINCVNNNMSSDSHYVGKFREWKELERTRESVRTRANREFQARPFLSFDIVKKGLCIVLPRIIIRDEWISEVNVAIHTSEGLSFSKRLIVTGDEGQRFTNSTMIPVSPAQQYTITYSDGDVLPAESEENNSLIEWEIGGVPCGGFLAFNANGRLIHPSYLYTPYMILVQSSECRIIPSKSMDLSHLHYPTDIDGYSTISVRPLSIESSLIINTSDNNYVLTNRPQIVLDFDGKTLLGLPLSKRVFVELPILKISADESSIASGLEIRFGDKSIPLDSLSKNGSVEISLSRYKSRCFNEYGTYSIRLYQFGHFLKQAEFSYVPKIKSDYAAGLPWPEEASRRCRKSYWFECADTCVLEFENCTTYQKGGRYVTECHPSASIIHGLIKSNGTSGGFSCHFDFPVVPFEIGLLDSGENELENSTGRVARKGLTDFQNEECWLSFTCFGDYKDYTYELILRTSNGIEQTAPLTLSLGGGINCSLSAFYDTLNSCPLPAQFEIKCIDLDKTIPFLIVSDSVNLNRRPKYNSQGYIELGVTEGEKDITIRRFGLDPHEQTLLYANSKESSSHMNRGYKYPGPFQEGIYTVDNHMQQSSLAFDDLQDMRISNGNNTFYFSTRDKTGTIESISDWLDNLVFAICFVGPNADLKKYPFFQNRDRYCRFQNQILSEFDYERIISLAYFINDNCAESKKQDIIMCMQSLSINLLRASDRYYIIKMLINLGCPQEVFDICMDNYALLLFEADADAKTVAEQVEPYSLELSMLLLMSIDTPIRSIVGKEKFRDLIGREALWEMIDFTVEKLPEEKDNLRKQFLKENSSDHIRISLPDSISGNSNLVSCMIEDKGRYVYLNKAKKPDEGTYLCHIRYVDQFIIWYTRTHDRFGNLFPDIENLMLRCVSEECERILNCFDDLSRLPQSAAILTRYKKALAARYGQNPLNTLNRVILNRYFYIEGLAAFLSVCPKNYKGSMGKRAADRFLSLAFIVSPGMARRDLIMAATFQYFARKEVALCR